MWASSAKNAWASSTVIPSTSGVRLAAELDLECLPIVARALAFRTWRVNAWQEQQFDADEAFSLAIRAAALRQVEGESPGIEAAPARLLGLCEQLSHIVEQTGVDRQIGARSLSDRLLVYDDQPLQAIKPFGDLAARGLDRRAFKDIFTVVVGCMRLPKMPTQRLDEPPFVRNSSPEKMVRRTARDARTRSAFRG